MRKTLGAAIMLWAGMSATVAQAADAKPCLTRAEAENLFTALMPDFVDGIGKKCVASLPENATLRSGLAPLLTKYRSVADAAWPQAVTALSKVAGSDMKGVDMTAMRPMVGPMIASMVAQGFKPDDCAVAERAATLLAPLPPENLAGLVVMFAEMGTKGKKDSPLTICPTDPAATPIPAAAPKHS